MHSTDGNAGNNFKVSKMMRLVNIILEYTISISTPAHLWPAADWSPSQCVAGLWLTLATISLGGGKKSSIAVALGDSIVSSTTERLRDSFVAQCVRLNRIMVATTFMTTATKKIARHLVILLSTRYCNTLVLRNSNGRKEAQQVFALAVGQWFLN